MFLILIITTIKRLFVIAVVLSILTTLGFAQRNIKGQVIDSKTGKGIPLASISWSGHNGGTSTDTLGNFHVILRAEFDQLACRAVGYETKIVDLDVNKDSVLTVLLMSKENKIDEVVVERKAKKYKDPALALIENIIAHKDENHISRLKHIKYEAYEKSQFGAVNFKSKLNKLTGKLKFLFENTDTISIPGSSILPFYLQENLSEVYSTYKPSRNKEIIIGHKVTELNKRYINNANIQSYFQDQFRSIDLYDNNIQLISKSFLSPIAGNAPSFYKYTIRDTLVKNNERFIELYFEAKSKMDVLFKGSIWVSDDDRYAVYHADMQLGEEANINWINAINIGLEFEKHPTGQMLPTRSDLQILFGTDKGNALYGKKETYFTKYNDDVIKDEVFSGVPIEKKYLEKTDSINWDHVRVVPLTQTESKTYTNIDSLSEMKSINRLMAVGYFLARSYYNLGEVELGPLEYTYSFNDIEGSRIRLGGRTTEMLSNKFFIEGYAAYGTKDQEFKYYLNVAHSLNGNSIVQFPAHYLSATVQHDVMEPGRGLSYLKGDGFFQSFRRNKPNKWLRNDIFRLEHLVEFGNHFSISTAFTHHERSTAGDLFFVTSSTSPDTISGINTNDIQIRLRWAPGEQFYYRNLNRRQIENRYPVLSLQYNKGLDGFWNADQRYDALRFKMFKRIFMSPAGTADVELSAGKIWGSLYYPLLEIPDIQTDKSGSLQNFDLMSNMEFVADRFVKFSYYHHWGGYIFNRIPLLKRLKWREVTGFKFYYGKLSDRNNPELNKSLIQFDRDDDGIFKTRVMGNQPYMEGIVGIDNIFKIFRVEYKRRLSYLNYPNVSRDTFGVSVHLNF
ncbi:DUF5686 and carboxypeptidase regulatory-like domain-containing protein [Sphingobacterium sp. SRCM116780]|uniref:DUF5686 and carboxypeptidase-like regulatory domain-containing protein n=1 Tax=Sphingobacterium sp. SRCM116780 TaxID=2907623 RepID=UPI001F249DA0|nr:DUF5686 and carboxypeptidase-like regulatory domain-containing protein [Sphingobacterium sp. SRCM116780]UIR55878.1 DUF5686 and carboxypeptidase regulatory-like domain-containing protein [Sphingobacterium sp. SRCM116780]